MQISKEQLEKFKQIYKDKGGEELSDEKALREATDLLNLIKAIYQPIEKEAVLDHIIEKGLKKRLI